MEHQNYIVTITNQFCSLGRVIADRLGEKLGVRCYNEQLVEAAARELELPAELVDENEERSKRIVGDTFFPMFRRLGDRTNETQNQIFDTQRQIIQSLAERESCIIVGRCSDFILSERENTIHIYIYAPFEDRVRNCVEQLGMEEEEARRLVVKTDEERCSYHMNFTGFLPDDKKHKDLLIDSTLLGVEDTAALLADITRKRFSLT